MIVQVHSFSSFIRCVDNINLILSSCCSWRWSLFIWLFLFISVQEFDDKGQQCLNFRRVLRCISTLQMFHRNMNNSITSSEIFLFQVAIDKELRAFFSPRGGRCFRHQLPQIFDSFQCFIGRNLYFRALNQIELILALNCFFEDVDWNEEEVEAFQLQVLRGAVVNVIGRTPDLEEEELLLLVCEETLLVDLLLFCALVVDPFQENLLVNIEISAFYENVPKKLYALLA